jgi:hypothetical protein
MQIYISHIIILRTRLWDPHTKLVNSRVRSYLVHNTSFAILTPTVHSLATDLYN